MFKRGWLHNISLFRVSVFVERQRWLHHIFSVLAPMLTEAIIVYGREDKRRNLKIVRSKEFRPNFPAEQNVGRIWRRRPKCFRVGKVHQHWLAGGGGRSGVQGVRCALCYIVLLCFVLYCATRHASCYIMMLCIVLHCAIMNFNENSVLYCYMMNHTVLFAARK